MNYSQVKKARLREMLTGWETRHKLIGLTALIFSFAYIREPVLLLLLLPIAGIVYYLAGLSLAYLISRMRLPGIMLIVSALILSFAWGSTVIAQCGAFTLRYEGVFAFFTIGVKLTSIYIMALAFFAGTPKDKLTGVLHSLGLQFFLTRLIFFAHRYFYQVSADMRRVQTTAALRGFRKNHVFSFKALVYMFGSLFIHSFAQPENDSISMTQQDFRPERASYKSDKPRPGDRLALVCCLMAAVVLVMLQVFSEL